MKVVLFCGGRGLRLREHSEAIPKPMVQIGYRPILWHVMRYYAHYGHRDFILCLGYRADAIKDYFLRYSEAVSNDFVLSEGGRRIELLGSDIEDWRITFADTGLDTTIGERLRRVRHLLEGEEMFLANYGDTLTDAPLDRLVERFLAETATGALLSVRPSGYPFRVVRIGENDRVERITAGCTGRPLDQRRLLHAPPRDLHVLEPGDELVEAPFARLIAAGRLGTERYEGFWDRSTRFATLSFSRPWPPAGVPRGLPGSRRRSRRGTRQYLHRSRWRRSVEPIDRSPGPAQEPCADDPRGERPPRRCGDRCRRDHRPPRRRAARRHGNVVGPGRSGPCPCRRGSGERRTAAGRRGAVRR